MRAVLNINKYRISYSANSHQDFTTEAIILSGHHIPNSILIELSFIVSIHYDSVDSGNLYRLDRVDKLKYAYVRSVTFDRRLKAYIQQFCLD